MKAQPKSQWDLEIDKIIVRSSGDNHCASSDSEGLFPVSYLLKIVNRAQDYDDDRAIFMSSQSQ